MDFKTKVGELMSQGYKRASARAKIAHDVVLADIKSSGMNRVTLKDYFNLYVYRDRKMRERTPADIVARLSEVFQDAIFKRQLRNKKFAWLNVAPEIATKAILDYVLTIR